MNIGKPERSEHAAYYRRYVDLVAEVDVLVAMRSQRAFDFEALRAIPESEATVLHDPYTWTIKQVVNHLSDSERVFAYRALRIARGDATPLPGFDENAYAKMAATERVPLLVLVEELQTVRRATIALFEYLPVEAWTRTGIANNHAVSVRALAWIMVGHAKHHLEIIAKRLNGSVTGVTA